MGKHGGARAGSGRKTKAEILGLAEMLSSCISQEDEMAMWKMVKDEAISKKNIGAAQFYIAYKYGKPTETINQKSDITQVIKLIDDTE